ncbi:hypothetical protein CHS0354_029975 [Potamilus streckersoni]|uniref:Uncharacterized protein n=1 Tax=Potamilus streckersoni TaxID=2493646 RepID=A0AAE0WFQ9_9BIVA|nr:hypothetical protein CHS0354_029975 [Potamilus streckersoni]
MLTVVLLGTIFIQLRHVAAASYEPASLLSECELHSQPTAKGFDGNDFTRIDDSLRYLLPENENLVPFIPDYMKIQMPLNVITRSGVNGISESSDCIISLHKSSVSKFRHEVWYNEWNYVSLHLTFPDGIEVQGTKDVVGPLVWIWTFYGNKGALEFLSWPIEFGIWSMGFLNAYSGDLPNFKLNVTGNCSNMVVGENKTNYAISTALKEAADQLANVSEIYGPSFWCFKTRIFINPDFIYYMCLHMVCPVEALKYQCCSNFFNTMTQKRDVSCPGENKNGLTFTYDVLWWVFPTVLAVLLFAFSPLLLMNMACRVCKLTESFNVKGYVSDKSYEEISDRDENQSESDEEWVFYSEQKAVTIFSTFFLPIGRRLMGHGSKVSIVFRVLVPIFSLSIIVLQIILDWIYLRDFVIEGVQKGVPMGFRSMIAGFDDSKRNFLRYLGGPYIACGLYLFITCLFLALPPDLSLFLERGLKNTHDVPTSAIRLDFRSIERLGSVSFCNRKGYKKIYRLFLAQFYMLINLKFWKEAIEMQRQRWNQIDIQRRWILLPLYVLMCVMELIACFLYYGLPILPFTVTVIRAYCGHLLKLVKNYKLAIFRYIGFVLLLIVTAAVLFFVYMFCTIFLDACLFFSRVCIFTYTGIIVYPKISYGYLIFSFTIVYYLWDSVKEYSEKYQRLLKVVIRVCKSLEKAERGQRLVVSQNGTEGISGNIFEHVIERHCPRRKQIFESFLKVIIILVILGLSVNLLMKTDQFKELHVVMHVGTALFICAFPKILGSMCSNSDRRMKSKRRVQKVMKTVRDYLGYIPANYECRDEAEDSDTPLISHPLVPIRHDTLPLNFGNANSHE